MARLSRMAADFGEAGLHRDAIRICAEIARTARLLAYFASPPTNSRRRTGGPLKLGPSSLLHGQLYRLGHALDLGQDFPAIEPSNRAGVSAGPIKPTAARNLGTADRPSRRCGRWSRSWPEPMRRGLIGGEIAGLEGDDPPLQLDDARQQFGVQGFGRLGRHYPSMRRRMASACWRSAAIRSGPEAGSLAWTTRAASAFEIVGGHHRLLGLWVGAGPI